MLTKKLLRVLCVVMVMIMIIPALFACGGEAETTEKNEQTEAPKDTETESETEQGEIEVPQEPLEIVKDGKSDFMLVINKYAEFINDKAAYMIQDAIEAASGIELALKMDYDLFLESLDILTRSKYEMELAWVANGGTPGKWADIATIEASYDRSAPYEILIGDTDRPESDRAIADLKGENEYIVRVDGNKLVLVASSNKALIAGAEYLISEYLSVETGDIRIESFDKSASIEVVVDENPEVFFGMTQTEVDEKFGDLLDGKQPIWLFLPLQSNPKQASARLPQCSRQVLTPITS